MQQKIKLVQWAHHIRWPIDQFCERRSENKFVKNYLNSERTKVGRIKWKWICQCPHHHSKCQVLFAPLVITEISRIHKTAIIARSVHSVIRTELDNSLFILHWLDRVAALCVALDVGVYHKRETYRTYSTSQAKPHHKSKWPGIYHKIHNAVLGIVFIVSSCLLSLQIKHVRSRRDKR